MKLKFPSLLPVRAIILGAMVLFAQQVHAANTTLTWFGGSDSWDTAGDWLASSGTYAGPPEGGYDAVINTGTATLTDGGGASVLFMGNSAGTTGQLNINGGTLETVDGTSRTCDIGIATAATETITVTNGGWYVYGSLIVGDSGAGTLSISGISYVSLGLTTGGASASGTAIIGNNAQSSGTLTISGGQFVNNFSDQTNAGGLLIVGNSGSGVINISGSGIIYTGTSTVLGNNAGAYGAMTITSGSFSPYGLTEMNIGSSGTGRFTVNGAYVLLRGAVLGVNATGTGSIIVTSGTLVSDDEVDVGGAGKGSLIINGGYYNSIYTFFGNGAGSVGSGTITSGTMLNQTFLIVGNSGTGTFLVNGGYVLVGDGGVGDGTPGPSGTLTVTSGTLASSGYFSIGRSGKGTLLINGGYVSDVYGLIGDFAGASGTTTITSGTWMSSGSVVAGDRAGGVLNVQGGLVSGSAGAIGNTDTGSSAANGTANVTSGTWSIANTMTVGSFSGTGILNVNGGYMSDADAVIGGGTLGAPILATVNVSSGTWTNANSVTVGSGIGTAGVLNISGGETDVGSGTGVVTLGAGVSSTGTLNYSGGVFNPGAITTGSGSGAVNFNLANSLTFTPALSGSLALSVSGAKALVLTGSAFYSGSTAIASSGTLQIGNDGTTPAALSGSMVNNGAFVVNSSSVVTIAGNFSGTGAFYQVGSGTTILTGTVGSSGTTTVNAGTLTVSGSIGPFSTLVVNGGVVNGSGGVRTVIVNGGTLAGNLRAYRIVVGNGGVVAPAGANGGPASINSTGSGTLAGGGDFVVSINNFTGALGSDPGWNKLAFGSLSITATMATPFVLTLNTLTLADVAGSAANFNMGRPYALTLVTTTNGISGFNASAFTVNTSGFANAFSGTFSVAQNGNNLQLDYTPPQTFESWVAGFSLSGTAADPTVDPDGDGVPNLIEYALGMDPTTPDAGGGELPQAGMETLSGQTYLTLTYQRPAGGGQPDITYTVEENDSLGNANGWSSVNVVQDSVTQTGGGLETVVMHYTTPLSGDGGGFMRLRVTK